MKTEADFVKVLMDGFNAVNEHGEKISKLEFLADYIFEFTTYDGDISELFAEKMVEVLRAINDGKIYEFIKDEENYKWYIIMCNMPFLGDKLEWGTSIRGAWWSYDDPFEVTMFTSDIGVVWLHLIRAEWKNLISAIFLFVSND